MSLHGVDVSAGRVPALLTVEEAAAVLRIGRTKAYAMARQWRDTDGGSGLPVIDLGHLLRVPRRALENMIGAELTDLPGNGTVGNSQHGDTTVANQPAPMDAPVADAATNDPADHPSSAIRNTRHRLTSDDQLGLFATQPPPP